MYGSSFCIVTRNPRDLSSRPRAEAVSPLPRELATPPVTKMCFVTGSHRTPHAVGGARMGDRSQRDAAHASTRGRGLDDHGVLLLDVDAGDPAAAADRTQAAAPEEQVPAAVDRHRRAVLGRDHPPPVLTVLDGAG